MATIQGFFNPTKQGDTFKGLAGGINGTVADRVISDLPTFLRAAGRDYFIRKSPVYQRLESENELGKSFEYAEVGNQFHLVRSSDSRVVSPHTVSDQYAPLSLMDIAEELQPWCEQGWCSPDGVYSGRDESLEILSLRLDAGGQELPEGEKFLHYIVFQNPHGSGGMAKGKIISWRIVCQNTFAAAVSATADFRITHRVASGDHTVQNEIMCGRAEKAVAAWQQAKDHIRKLSERINTWNAVPLQYKDAAELTDRLLGIKDLDNTSTRTKNRRDAILSAFAMPKFGTHGRTAWDWLNGVTFVNSSPLADGNKKSKTSAIDRAIRTLDVNGTGFKLELEAEQVLAEMIG